MPLIITDGFGTNRALPSPALPDRSSIGIGASKSATDFGQDFEFLNGLNPAFLLVGGYANLGQALAHRLETPRGGLFYDPDYGTDVRGYLNSGFTPAMVSSLVGAIQGECLKDERVQVCSASVAINGSTMTVAINVITAEGPFPYVLSVTAASVELLNSQFNG